MEGGKRGRAEGGGGAGAGGAYGASPGSGELYCLLLIESVWALGADNLYTFTVDATLASPESP